MFEEKADQCFSPKIQKKVDMFYPIDPDEPAGKVEGYTKEEWLETDAWVEKTSRGWWPESKLEDLPGEYPRTPEMNSTVRVKNLDTTFGGWEGEVVGRNGAFIAVNFPERNGVKRHDSYHVSELKQIS